MLSMMTQKQCESDRPLCFTARGLKSLEPFDDTIDSKVLHNSKWMHPQTTSRENCGLRKRDGNLTSWLTHKDSDEFFENTHTHTHTHRFVTQQEFPETSVLKAVEETC